MKKLLLAMAGSMLLAGHLFAQNTFDYNWLNRVGSSGTERGRGVITDANDNAIAVGTYGGSVTFGTGVSLNQTNGGGVDAYVVRYDVSGTAQWAVKIVSTSDDYAYGLTEMGSDIYIVGHSNAGSVTAYNNGGTNIGSVTLNGNNTVFIIKMANGSTAPTSISSVAIAEANEYAYGYGITNDGTNVYITGTFGGNNVLNQLTVNTSTTTTLTCTTNKLSMFYAKVNSSLTPQLAVAPASMTDDNEGYAISYYSSNCYITGYFKGSIKFSSASAVAASGTRDVYVAKIGTSATTWAAQMTGGSSYTETPVDLDARGDVGRGISANVNGVFVTGQYYQNATFTDNSGTTSSISGTGTGSDHIRPFFMKLTTGMNWSWANVYTTTDPTGGTNHPGGAGWAVSVNGSDVFFTGTTRLDARFNGASSTLVDIDGTATAIDMGFVCRYSGGGTSNGQLKMADQLSRDEKGATGYGIFTTSCLVRVTGGFSTSLRVGNNTTNLSSAGGEDGFVLELTKDTWITASSNCVNSSPVSICLTASGSPTYSWSPGTNLSSTTVACPTWTAPGSTPSDNTFTVTITGGCPTNARNAIVTVKYRPPLSNTVVDANAGTDKISCCGSLPQVLGNGVNWATYGYTYSWTGPSSFTSSVYNPSVSVNGTYTLSMTHPCDGSTGTGSVVVSETSTCCRIASTGETNDGISLYPNPGNGLFILAIDGQSSVSSIRVFDIMGEVVYAAERPASGKTEIDMSRQPKGVYIAELQKADGSRITYRLVIQ